MHSLTLSTSIPSLIFIFTHFFHQESAGQVAVLSAALQRSNRNLEVCHKALRDVLKKRDDSKLQAQSQADRQILHKRVETLQRELEAKSDALYKLRKQMDEQSRNTEEADKLRAHLKEVDAERAHLAQSLAEAEEALEQQTDEAIRNQIEHERESQKIRSRAVDLHTCSRSLRHDMKSMRQDALSLMTGFQEDMWRIQQALIGAVENDPARKKVNVLERQIQQTQAELESAEEARLVAEEHANTLASKRRELHDLVQKLRGNIRVMCRVRPLNRKEIGNNVKPSIVAEERANSVSLLGNSRQDDFEYDHVFGENATQQEIFNNVEDLVVSALDGYRVCIFAYGQTGSGKTHTMEGPRNDPGLNTRAVNRLFEITADRSSNGEMEYSVTMSMTEIYNDQIFDLLDADSSSQILSPTKRGYDIRTDKEGTVVVKDLTEMPVASFTDVKKALSYGAKQRAVFATGVHDRSSRSHCIVTLNINGKHMETGTMYSGKLNLVDLAGSENVSRSKVEGARLREAQHINKSLSALGDVFLSLASKKKHVPYRNSKLTHMLSDSLGGDSKTLMMVCVNPGRNCNSESLNSLKFAQRARTVQLGPATQHKKHRNLKLNH